MIDTCLFSHSFARKKNKRVTIRQEREEKLHLERRRENKIPGQIEHTSRLLIGSSNILRKEEEVCWWISPLMTRARARRRRGKNRDKCQERIWGEIERRIWPWGIVHANLSKFTVYKKMHLKLIRINGKTKAGFRTSTDLFRCCFVSVRGNTGYFCCKSQLGRGRAGRRRRKKEQQFILIMFNPFRQEAVE